MELSDEALVAGCRGGDEAAWEIVIERYQRLIYAIARRAGLDEQASAEVFQQTFTLLVQNLERITQPSQLQAWLVTTARRETLRTLRRERSFIAVFGSHASEGADASRVMEHIPDDALLPDDALVKLEEQHRVRAAVAQLDERCRELITLLFYRQEHGQYAEIAAQLGVPEGSIGPTRARCLKKLLRALNNLKRARNSCCNAPAS